MHPNSMILFQKYALTYFRVGGLRVLEIGPDGVPSSYDKEIKSHGLPVQWEYLDLEVLHNPLGTVTHQAKGEYEFGLPENTYDIVISGQVLEHVRKIWRWMPELVKVAKSGGVVITTNPVSWPYHAGHLFDCWRVYSDGMKSLYEDFGLDVIMSSSENVDSSAKDVVDTITIGRKP
jgi:hypothetical protein